MSVFNQSRSRIIRLIFLGSFLVIFAQLFYLQVISGKFKGMADDNAILRKIIYPPRGAVFDRKHRVMVDNIFMYDLMLTPQDLKGGIDTTYLCNLLSIDTIEFRKRVENISFRNGRFRPSVFEPLLSPEKYARVRENIWRFNKGFFLQERPIRKYPFSAGANIFGYISEVDSNFLKKHPDEEYESGDYAGYTGIEKTYEKALMGERGIQYLIKDNFNRIQGPYENGTKDETAVAGSNLYTSLDIELQQLGEKLMTNKVGSIVAVDPKTGSIIAMVSSPTYDPGYLTGAERRKHFSELYVDPRLPLINRAVNASYSPGSTFKTLQALIGLHENMITTDFRVSCSGAFYGCGSGRPMKCLDRGTFDLRSAIRISDNTYFATVMQRVIDNPKYPSIDSSLSAWNNYMYAFGLGHKLGVDVPTEIKGNIPTPAHFDKVYGAGNWNYCNFRSVSIGQGEVSTTPIQVANEMAYLANKGWYIIPHIVDSIAGGDKFGLLDKYKNKINPVDIPDTIFDAVHDGMQGVVESGTGVGAKVPGVIVCGKTGTVENYAKIKGELVKQPNHSFFTAFAPRENPKIAIMCVVENSGRFGGSYAAPIVGLMIEKYLNDTIASGRKGLIEKFTNLNLIPPLMAQKIKDRDSIQRVKAEAAALKNLKDSLQVTIDPSDDDTISIPANTNLPFRDTQEMQNHMTDSMLLPGKQNALMKNRDSINKPNN
jgi:penicillin-binding protein 2